MNIGKSLSILIAISTSAACGKISLYQGGAPDAQAEVADAPGMDAAPTVYEDARIYEDARVYEDAPPARACANVSQVIAPYGVETITATLTCLSPDDASTANITVFGYSVQNEPHSENFVGSVVCGVNTFVVPNNWDDLLVVRIQNDAYDLSCN